MYAYCCPLSAYKFSTLIERVGFVQLDREIQAKKPQGSFYRIMRVVKKIKAKWYSKEIVA